MLRLRVTPSLLVFLVIVVAVGFAIGHGFSALGIAVFLFLLAGIDAKPSWKRIFDPDPRAEGGVLRFMSWKWPGMQRAKSERPPKL